jgi:hypothetical protein
MDPTKSYPKTNYISFECPKCKTKWKVRSKGRKESQFFDSREELPIELVVNHLHQRVICSNLRCEAEFKIVSDQIPAAVEIRLEEV